MQSMNQISLNISNQGLVPNKAQKFCVFLPCGPQQFPTDLEVFMKINFTSSSNFTSLNVVMNKDCTAGI